MTHMNDFVFVNMLATVICLFVFFHKIVITGDMFVHTYNLIKMFCAKEIPILTTRYDAWDTKVT